MNLWKDVYPTPQPPASAPNQRGDESRIGGKLGQIIKNQPSVRNGHSSKLMHSIINLNATE